MFVFIIACQNKTVHCLNTIATTLLTPRKEFMTIDHCKFVNFFYKLIFYSICNIKKKKM